MAMATLISTPTTSFSTSTRARSLLHPCSPISCCKATNFGLSTKVPQLGSGNLSQWSGLKQLSISITPKSLHKERKGRCNGRVVRASLFGVGAPEALVIGVVALLVFGPKGLAEVARNLGKTLREFQPTIRELQDVSREFKSTLEKEIGLDEIKNVTQTTNFSNKTPSAPPPAASPPSSSVTSAADSTAQAEPNGSPAPSNAYTSDDLLKVTEEQLKASASQQQPETPALDSQPEAKVAEEQPEASDAQQQKPTPSTPESQVEEAQAQPTVKETAAALSPGSAKPESET
ncbi:unnamed protein product [Linum tenue]|uniref:Sec-independent protein translocase protein TATB, chloroplastic n=1 Tax=Linum tenue TaxID=586396 RepID=A0AAV0QNP8_9ROSI|nr:unnamed protein product [Linum tenue]